MAYVYVDVLFGVNFIIDFLLLWATSVICRNPLKWWRLCMGAALGSLYAVLMFFPNLKFGYTAIAKLLFSAALVECTFWLKRLKPFLKTLAVFYMVSFAFGGCVLAIFYFTSAGAKMGAMISNGIIYFNLPWALLLLSTIAAYAIIRIVWKGYQNRITKESLYTTVKIVYGGREAIIPAFLDTGNNVKDPLTQKPVMIAELSELKPLLPPVVLSLFSGGDNSLSYDALEQMDPHYKLQLIPYRALGNKNGMLVGFPPEKITVLEDKNEFELLPMLVAIYPQKLSSDTSYHALLSMEMLQNNMEGI